MSLSAFLTANGEFPKVPDQMSVMCECGSVHLPDVRNPETIRDGSPHEERERETAR